MRIITEKFAVLVGFLLTLTLLVGGFNIGGIALFKWLLLILCILCGISTKKLRLEKFDTAFIIFIISIGFSIVGAASTGYIEVSFIIGNLINIVLIAITVKMMEEAGNLVMISFVKGIKFSCYFQGIYCALQGLFRRITGYSLNRFILADFLHINNEHVLRDIIGDGSFVEYGMNAHPSVLIPIVIIIMCFGKKKAISLALSIIIVVLSKNSTSAIAFVLCLVLPWLIQTINALFINRQRKYSGKKIIITCLGIFTGAIILFSTGWHLKLFEMLNRAWTRLWMNAKAADNSSRIHTLYYTSIPAVLGQMNVLNVMFGNGFNSSGDVITHAGIIFKTAKNWAVESDPVDLLYGIGIFGVGVFYYWFIKGIKKGCKWDNQYAVFAITTLVCGVTYRIQYLWVIMFELTLFRLISKGVDITAIGVASKSLPNNQKQMPI